MNAVFYHAAVRSPRVGMDSMQVMIRNMAQLVRIAGDVNCNDLVVLDLQRGGLQRIVLLEGDEAWQAIDEAVAHEPRHKPAGRWNLLRLLRLLHRGSARRPIAAQAILHPGLAPGLH